MGRFYIAIFTLLIGAGIFNSCAEKEVEGTGTFELRLTDAPGDYEEVLVDIEAIEINVNGDEDGGWITLKETEKGIYDLLKLTNGVDTLLVSEQVPAGNIQQIRLVLGTENQVKIDGVYHNLKTPSAQQSGLKLKVNAPIASGVTYQLWLDFDAKKSILKTGNNNYILKPVIKAFTKAASGSISGTVSPVNVKTHVLAVSEMNDSIQTYADTLDGEFLLSGMPESVYKVTFSPEYPTKDTTVYNVSVKLGRVTQLGTVFLDTELILK